MASSEAKVRANVRYNQSRDSITLRPSKEDGAEIRQAAEQAGQALSAYILQAVRERMERGI